MSLTYMLSHAHPKMVTNSLHFVTFVLKFVTELLRKEKSSHTRLLLTSKNIYTLLTIELNLIRYKCLFPFCTYKEKLG